MAKPAPKSWVREIIIGVLVSVISTVAAAFFTVRLGLEKADKPAPPAAQAPVRDVPPPPASMLAPRSVAGCLQLQFTEDPPGVVEVLLRGQRVVARHEGARLKFIDAVPSGNCEVTIRCGNRHFDGAVQIVADRTTTLEVHLPAVVQAAPLPLKPATGMLVPDLPEDVGAGEQENGGVPEYGGASGKGRVLGNGGDQQALARQPEAARQESARQEAARHSRQQALARQPEAARREALRQEAARREAVRQEVARQHAYILQVQMHQHMLRQHLIQQHLIQQHLLRQHQMQQSRFGHGRR